VQFSQFSQHFTATEESPLGLTSHLPQQAIAEKVPIENNSMVISVFFIFIDGY